MTFSLVPISKVTDTYYEAELANDKVTFGGESYVEFKPKASVTRWREAALSLELREDQYVNLDKSTVLSADSLTWESQSVKCRFYLKPPAEQYEHGALEYELILKQKPPSNTLTFQLDTANFKYVYQPPLHPDHPTWLDTTGNGEPDTFRPENVVGSYAVKHASKQGNRYMTGKAYHLYRPLITDAKNNQTYGSLNIDQANSTLQIVIDKLWLKKAVYPVTVDPTFGKTDIGASNQASGDVTQADDYTGSRYTLGVAGNVTSMTGHVYHSAWLKDSYEAIYDVDGSNDPNNREALSTKKTSQPEWIWETYTISASLAAGTYYLVHWYADNWWGIKYDAGTELNNANNAAGPPDPFGGIDTTKAWDFSIYATYDVAGGISIPVAMHHYGHIINKIIRG